jgi:hypothetical protein
MIQVVGENCLITIVKATHNAIDVYPRTRRMAVKRYLGLVDALTRKARPSGDKTGAQWPWHGPKSFISRHYATAAYRGRFDRVVKFLGASDPCRPQLFRHDNQRRG